MRPEQGDVVRSVDPFEVGDNSQRPWLILNNDSHPFGSEQFIAVAISTKEYDDSIALEQGAWTVGGVPRQSFVSAWAVHSPRVEDLVAWQGRVTEEFVRGVATALETYLQ